MYLLTGQNDNITWTIQIRLNKNSDYFSLVKVDEIVKVTDYFTTFDECKAAAESLIADTIAQLVDSEL